MVKLKIKNIITRSCCPLHAIANRRKNIFCMFISETLTQGVDTLCAVGKPLVVKRVNKFLSLRDLFYKSKQSTLYKVSLTLDYFGLFQVLVMTNFLSLRFLFVLSLSPLNIINFENLSTTFLVIGLSNLRFFYLE